MYQSRDNRLEVLELNSLAKIAIFKMSTVLLALIGRLEPLAII